jgi:peptide-methionine (S)-S-oxide reductase
VKGVQQAMSGYSGGTKVSPSYEDVSSGSTGHAESVKITYDPTKISYGELLRIFFAVAHNPTELNYQGPDQGTQYRSNIFYADAAQQKVAAAYITQLTTAKVYKERIVTRVGELQAFYPAESYHQDFLTLHPDNPYIVINDLPKIADLKRLFPSAYSETPVLVGGAAPRS